LGVRAIGIGKREEADRLVADELRVTGGEEARGGRQADGEVRHLRALAGCEIEHNDLDGLLALGPRPEIREGDPTAVRAKGYRSRRGHIEHESAEGIREDAEARVAARGAETTQATPVGAHKEDPLLVRWQRRAHVEYGGVIGHLVYDA